MTRSTVQPEPLRLWRLEATDEGLRLHLSARWNAKHITIEDDRDSHQEWEYDTIRFVLPYDGARDGVQAWLAAQESRILLIAKTLWEVEHDAPALTTADAQELADYATQERIRTALHPLAGAGEEIKALREELKALRKLVGGTPTTGFQRLDSIAIREIGTEEQKT